MIGQPSIHQFVALVGRRPLLLLCAAFALAFGVMAISASRVEAAAPKVVVVVGPSGEATSRYIKRARVIAAQARSYGAKVIEIYTPRATWSRVVKGSRGAKVFVYLGHGNGSPSPYGPLNVRTMNGLGLNPRSGHGKRTPVKYYGEAHVGSKLHFARGAVVLLNHLCYASGNGEPGHREPSWRVARKRVDNFATGFIRAGARAVLADGHTNLSYELAVVFGPRRNLANAWKDDPEGHGHVHISKSKRHPGFRNLLDPDAKSKGFYRSLTVRPTFKVGFTRHLRVSTINKVYVRRAPSTASRVRFTVKKGTKLKVYGALVTDARGRTWAPVKTAGGRKGYVAAWLTRFSGSAEPRANVIVRASPSRSSRALTTIRRGTPVTVIGSTRSSARRVWLHVRAPNGRVGWMAGWLMRP